MSTVFNALHVVLAVLVIGPLVVAPFAARWAIARRSADGVRFAANVVALFGAGAVLVAGLGVATVLTGDEWSMVTPWVLISSTLFVVALGLTWGYAVPALRRATSLVSAGGLDQHNEPAQIESPDTERSEVDTEPPPPLAADGSFITTADLAARQRLDGLSARITGAGWLLLVTFVAITVLMTLRPFD